MKRIPKVIAVVLAVSILASLAACFGTNSEPSGSSSKAAGSSASANTGEKKQVVVFTKKREWKDGWDKLEAAYEKEHQNVDVVVNITDANNYDDLLKGYLASDDLPDIIQTDAGTALNVWKEHLEDVSDVSALKKMPEDLVKDYNSDGKYYGVPLFMELHGVIYNMKYLNQVGYAKAPETLDQFIDLNEKLQKAGLPTGISPWKTAGSIVGHMTAPVFSSHSNSLDYMHQIRDGKADLTKDSDWNGLFDYLDATIKYGNKDALNTDNTTERNALYTEKYAWYAHDGSWLTPQIKSTNADLEKRIQLGVYPYSNDASKNKIGCSTQALSIMKTKNDVTEVKKFVDWMLGSDEGSSIFVKDCHTVILRTDFKMSDEDVGVLSTQGINYVTSGKSYVNFRHIPQKIQANLSSAVQKYLSGNETRKDTLQNIQKQFESSK